MSRWFARVDGLLFDGETVETRVDVGEGGVVVTSHRVLAFTPDDEGSNFEYVDRPNVDGVERTARGQLRFAIAAVKAILVGAVLLAAGHFVSLDGLVGSIDMTGAGGMGLGGFLSAMQTLLNLLAVLDEILTALGALVLLLGAFLLGVYAWTRTDLLVVEVAGGDDVELRVGEGDEENEGNDLENLADRLNRAVRPEGGGEADDRHQADGQHESENQREPERQRESEYQRESDGRRESDRDPLA